jgi:uncharacterized protein (TIGR02300 family)
MAMIITTPADGSTNYRSDATLGGGPTVRNRAGSDAAGAAAGAHFHFDLWWHRRYCRATPRPWLNLQYGDPALAKPEWGIKRICQACGIRYYDFDRSPIACPKCDTVFDPEAVLKSRRARVAVVEPPKPKPAADLDDTESEDEESEAEDEEDLDDDDAAETADEEEDAIPVADDEDVEDEDESDDVIEDTSDLGDDDDVAVIDNVDEEER